MQTMRSLAEKHMTLAADYSAASTMLGMILSRKPAAWRKFRTLTSSDKAADRAYEGTDDDITETGLRLKLKAIEKEIGALKSMLSVLDGESRNNY